MTKTRDEGPQPDVDRPPRPKIAAPARTAGPAAPRLVITKPPEVSLLAPAYSQVSLGTGELSSPRWGGKRGRPGHGRQRSFIAERGPGLGQRPYFPDNFNRANWIAAEGRHASNDVDVKIVNRQWNEIRENLQRRAVDNNVAVNESIRVLSR